MATIKKAQGGGLIRKGLRIINPTKDAAGTQKMIKKIKKTETPFVPRFLIEAAAFCIHFLSVAMTQHFLPLVIFPPDFIFPSVRI